MTRLPAPPWEVQQGTTTPSQALDSGGSFVSTLQTQAATEAEVFTPRAATA